jgi:hypothetical protein
MQQKSPSKSWKDFKDFNMWTFFACKVHLLHFAGKNNILYCMQSWNVSTKELYTFKMIQKTNVATPIFHNKGVGVLCS